MKKSNQELTFELLEKTGLNWTVKKEPLQTADGKLTESFGMFRNDNDEWLGTVGNQYTPMQNFELAQLLIEAGQTMNLDFSSGGQLSDGRLVYLQTDLADAHIGNDTLKRKLTALNSHNGRTSIGFGTTNTVVVCQNTFHRALRDKSMSKFRHSSNAMERIKLMVEEIKHAVTGEQYIVESMKRMTDHKIQKQPFDRVMTILFGKEHDLEKVSGRKRNDMNKFGEVMESEIASHGNTLWGLFNAVTYYTNHVKKEKDMEYLMNGGGQRINGQSFDAIMNWVTDNTAELVPVSK